MTDKRKQIGWRENCSLFSMQDCMQVSSNICGTPYNENKGKQNGCDETNDEEGLTKSGIDK